MRKIILLLCLATPVMAQEAEIVKSDYPLKVEPTVQVVCFKNRVEAEVLASSYKGYEVYKNDTQGKINYCVLPPTHGETLAWISEN